MLLTDRGDFISPLIYTESSLRHGAAPWGDPEKTGDFISESLILLRLYQRNDYHIITKSIV